MKSQIRRSKEEEYKKVLVCIPKGVLWESKSIAAANFPDPYYSFSHYVTSALIKQNREVENAEQFIN